MYENFGNTIAVPVMEIINAGIITDGNYRKLVERKKIKVLQRGCLGTPALADYNSFPERFRRIMETVFGDPKAERATNAVDEFLGQDTKAIEYFSSYEVDDNRYLPAETIKEYYANACVLNAIHLLLNSRRSLQKMCGGTVKAYWPTIAKNVMDLDREQYPHSLPLNDRRLKDRYTQYQKGSYEALIHKNFCNNNSAKVAEDAQQALMIEFLADPRNLDNAQVATLYNTVARAMKWKEITSSAVGVWRQKNETMIYAGRRGGTAFRNKKTMQVHRSAPTAPLYYLTLDGWDVELMYQEFDGKKTTYHQRPTAVIVLDPCVKYILGYALGTHETPELIAQALRNAMCHTAKLFGQMYRSHQIQSDRYAIKKMTPFYEAIGHLSTPAKAHNAKTKVIEPYFKHLNHDYCQFEKNWSGYGVTSDIENQPNIEYLNKYKKDFPDFEGVCKQFSEIIEKERAKKIDEYMNLWSSIGEDDKLEMSVENYLLTFGMTKGKTVIRESSGLHKTIDGIKYTWDSFDPSFRNYDHIGWTILFDPTDMTRALAVNDDRSLRFLLEKPYVQPMALKDRKPGDSGELQRVREFNASLEKQVSDFREQNILKMAAVVGVMQQNELLQKFCLTDSDGQHKNNRNANRRALSGKVQKGILKGAIVEDVPTESEEYNPFDKY